MACSGRVRAQPTWKIMHDAVAPHRHARLTPSRRLHTTYQQHQPTRVMVGDSLLESLKAAQQHIQERVYDTGERFANSAGAVVAEGGRVLAPFVALWHARREDQQRQQHQRPQAQEAHAARYSSPVLALSLRCQLRGASGALPLPKDLHSEP